MLAIELDTTLQALVVEALNDVLSKYGKRPAVAELIWVISLMRILIPVQRCLPTIPKSRTSRQAMAF